MANVFDVAEYILEQTGFVSTMKLQKLAFYSNALSLVRDGAPLFDDMFQAWVNGPVCPALFHAHRGRFIIGPGQLTAPGDAAKLTDHERRLISHTVDALGGYDGQQLSDLSHREAPWRDARRGCGDEDRCTAVISNAAIRRYYSVPSCQNPLFCQA
ncbi:MAG: Panacea domain-containing protein [Olsenella profusa]